MNKLKVRISNFQKYFRVCCGWIYKRFCDSGLISPTFDQAKKIITKDFAKHFFGEFEYFGGSDVMNKLKDTYKIKKLVKKS